MKINVYECLLETKYAEKARCIANAFARAGIETYLDIQNAPRRVGHVCQESIYSVVAELNKAIEKAESEPEKEEEEVPVEATEPEEQKEEEQLEDK